MNDDNYSNYTREELILKLKQLEQENNIRSNRKELELRKIDKKSFNFEKCKFRHVLLKFLYLGWNYHGYVTQEDTENTIEHHIFKALLKTCLIKDRSSSNYHRCGRTDKGVSSFSQVISLNVRSKSDNIEEELDYCNILNRVLPEDIHFFAWATVPNNFSARFDCKSRTYKYLFPKGRLNIEVMQNAAKYLIGTHDFRNFCKMDVNNGVMEYIRTITAIDIVSFDENDQESEFSMYVLTITGNAFLWHQIRCIVGVLVLIGECKEKPDVILELLDIATNPRRPAYRMASEIPLNLYNCQYEDIKWIHNDKVLNTINQKLHHIWAFHSIKSTMIKSMIQDLPLDRHKQDCDMTSESLIPGVQPKKYVPLMKRQLCDSLDEKIQKKRRKENAQTNLS